VRHKNNPLGKLRRFNVVIICVWCIQCNFWIVCRRCLWLRLLTIAVQTKQIFPKKLTVKRRSTWQWKRKTKIQSTNKLEYNRKMRIKITKKQNIHVSTHLLHDMPR